MGVKMFVSLAAAAMFCMVATVAVAADQKPNTPAESPADEPATLPNSAVIKEADAHVQAGRFNEALAQLRPLLQAGPVPIDALFIMSLAAIGASQQPGLDEDARHGLLDEAITVLRSVLVTNPGLLRIRLELARAFFLKEEDDLAKKHFEKVLTAQLPAPVIANVQRFLNIIRARKRWNTYFGFAFAPDTNIGSVSDGETVYINVFGADLPFRAPEATSGIGVSIWTGGEYQYPLADGPLRLRIGGNLSRREYKKLIFDRTYLSVHIGPRWLIDPKTEVSLLPFAEVNWTGRNREFVGVGARLEAGRIMSRRFSIFGRLSRTERRFVDATANDGSSTDLLLGGRFLVSPTLRLNFSTGLGRERPESRRARNTSGRLRADVTLALPKGYTIGGGSEIRLTRYAEPWPPLTPSGTSREDRTYTLRASAYNRDWTVLGFSPKLGLTWEKRDSNAKLYSYDRTQGELNFVRQF